LPGASFATRSANHGPSRTLPYRHRSVSCHFGSSLFAARDSRGLASRGGGCSIPANPRPFSYPLSCPRERVAKRLNISARTLQRRLNDWGVTFEELIDEYRRDRAARLLMRADHSIREIAYSLGYSDPAHFTRAFKRWTGVSPRSYRRAIVAGLLEISAATLHPLGQGAPHGDSARCVCPFFTKKPRRFRRGSSLSDLAEESSTHAREPPGTSPRPRGDEPAQAGIRASSSDGSRST
jgi:AraC-like DNA-binding protein